MNLRVIRHNLHFIKPARTSRNVLTERPVYYVLIDSEDRQFTGIGECAPIPGLSADDPIELEKTLGQLIGLTEADQIMKAIAPFSSLRFAFECAMLDLAHGGKRILFPGTTGMKIPVNGLVWMNDKEGMLQEARAKIASGYNTIKLKIGGISFSDEIDILRTLRREYSPEKLEIRLDANGAFQPEEAPEKLFRLSEFHIHSIEQPIKPGHYAEMALIAHKSLIPIALDEELIGVDNEYSKIELLDTIKPKYLILKPQLHGGFAGCDNWIRLATERGIHWWATSALESNIGLNAIAQWVASKDNSLPQGLGTGMLYSDNIPSPLRTERGYFFWDHHLQWELPGVFG